MKQKYKKPLAVPSPCVSICAMDDETGYCRGCMRTIKEIKDWERYADEQKRAVIDTLAARHAGKHYS